MLLNLKGKISWYSAFKNWKEKSHWNLKFRFRRTQKKNISKSFIITSRHCDAVHDNFRKLKLHVSLLELCGYNLHTCEKLIAPNVNIIINLVIICGSSFMTPHTHILISRYEFMNIYGVGLIPCYLSAAFCGL